MKLEATFATLVESNSFTVSAVYDFSTGPGTFTFDSASAFQVIGADDTVEVNPDINVDNTHPISITVSNDVSKRRLDLEKRVYTECKDTKQNDLLVLGYLGAKVLAKAAIQLIDSPGNGGQVYKNYFGSTTPSTIRDKFAAVLAVMNGAAPETGLSCSADIDKCKNLAISLAYTNLGKIYSCPDFFKITHTTELCKGASVNSYSDGGVILEQFTTIVVGTRLLLAGCPQITTLRDSDKLINSQNYQVGTQTSRGLPKTCVLTRGNDLCSASPLRPTKTPSAVFKLTVGISEGEGFRRLYAYMESCIIPALGTTLRKLCACQNRTCKMVRSNE